jgi:hypothetical protein
MEVLMTTSLGSGREARPDGEVCESIDGSDDMLDRWCSQTPHARAWSSRPPRAAAREAREPIGDSVADAWFR